MQGHRSAGGDGSRNGVDAVAQTHLPDDPDDVDGASADTAQTAETAEVPDAVHGVPPDSPGDPRPDAILDAISAMAAEVAVVRQQTADVLRVQRRQTAHIDELHSENQQLRKGEVQTALAPMIRDVVRLHDEVTRLAAVSAPEAADDMAIVGSRILDLLDRWGVAAHTPPVGTPFDPGLHQGVGRVDGPPSADGTIAAVRRPGFRDSSGRVIRPADVDVVRTAPTATPDTAPATPAGPSATAADDEPQTIPPPADAVPAGPDAVE